MVTLVEIKAMTFKEMIGWLVKRIISWITSLVSLGVVFLGITTQFFLSLTGGLIPQWMAWMATLGFVAAAAFSFVPLWSAIVIVLISVIFGVAGTPTRILFQKPMPSEAEPALMGVQGVQADSYAVEEEKDGIIMQILKIPPKIVHNIFLLLLGLIGTVTSEFWNSLYSQEAPYYEPAELELPKTNYPEELWIHVNGIGTDFGNAKASCREMYGMFGRPVGLLHNPTDGYLLDLLECIAGKTGLLKYGLISPRRKLMKILEEKLRGAKENGITKVVLIAHSQGTIITGNAISNLGRCPEGINVVDEELVSLMKELLEVYIVAGCAHHLPDNCCKHLEYLSNRGDFVAWLGHLFPKILAPFWRNTWFKPLYFSPEGVDHIESDLWGHFLDKHYLQPMKNGRFVKSKLSTEYMLSDAKKPLI